MALYFTISEEKSELNIPFRIPGKYLWYFCFLYCADLDLDICGSRGLNITPGNSDGLGDKSIFIFLLGGEIFDFGGRKTLVA